MKKQGFTLIELIAIIAILGIIALTTYPMIGKVMNHGQEKAYKEQVARIETAAIDYVLQNESVISEDADRTEISLITLKSLEYIKRANIINPLTEEVMNGCVVITKDTYGQYQAKYEEDEKKCTVKPAMREVLIYQANPPATTRYQNGNTKEMYTFKHAATKQTEALTDYRYIGANPNNYIEFNNEMWRIIGVFPVKNRDGKLEYRIKIVRDEPVATEMKWHSGEDNINEWTASTLNSYLNGSYYESLNAIAKGQIDDTLYYLGAVSEWNNVEGEKVYAQERGTTTHGNSRSISTVSKIALMYASDYTFTYALGIRDECYKNSPDDCLEPEAGGNSWLYAKRADWLLTPSALHSHSCLNITTARFAARNNINNNYSVRPTLYLRFNIQIKNGDGTRNNPYEIG